MTQSAFASASIDHPASRPQTPETLNATRTSLNPSEDFGPDFRLSRLSAFASICFSTSLRTKAQRSGDRCGRRNSRIFRFHHNKNAPEIPNSPNRTQSTQEEWSGGWGVGWLPGYSGKLTPLPFGRWQRGFVVWKRKTWRMKAQFWP